MNAAQLARHERRMAEFPGLTDEERKLLPGLNTDLRDEVFGRHDKASNALRKKLWAHGLSMCWPCQGSGIVNVDRSTQSYDKCETCDGRGYDSDDSQAAWSAAARQRRKGA